MLYSLFTLAALAFIPWLNYWNLIGFRWLGGRWTLAG